MFGQSVSKSVNQSVSQSVSQSFGPPVIELFSKKLRIWGARGEILKINRTS